jgi:hypothetical protein
MNKYLRAYDAQFWEFSIELSKEEIDLFQNGQTIFSDNVGVFESTFVSHTLNKAPDWTNLKNALFANTALLQKCFTMNAYPLLTGMILSAEDGHIVLEDNFLMGWNLLKSELTTKGTPLLQIEIDFINSKLLEFEFSITI